jgi:hypothetical protein
MSEVALKQTLELLPNLEPDELQQVSEAIRQRLEPSANPAALDAFHRALLESGLVLQIKTPPRTARETPLVPIQGPPLSQTIIEERR